MGVLKVLKQGKRVAVIQKSIEAARRYIDSTRRTIFALNDTEGEYRYFLFIESPTLPEDGLIVGKLDERTIREIREDLIVRLESDILVKLNEIDHLTRQKEDLL